MSVYSLPPEPDGPVWTSRDGAVVRWTRLPAALGGGWCWFHDLDEADPIDWAELLSNHGPVHDVHPGLDDLPPFPWSNTNGQVCDAGDYPIVRVPDPKVARLVVKVMNEYAERIGMGS